MGGALYCQRILGRFRSAARIAYWVVGVSPAGEFWMVKVLGENLCKYGCVRREIICINKEYIMRKSSVL